MGIVRQGLPQLVRTVIVLLEQGLPQGLLPEQDFAVFFFVPKFLLFFFFHGFLQFFGFFTEFGEPFGVFFRAGLILDAFHESNHFFLHVQVLFRVCFLAGDGGQGQEYGADGGDVFFHHGELIVNGLKPKEQILKIKDERGWIVNR